MPSPTIELLLILQDRDMRRLSIEAQQKAVPREIAAVEQRIAAEKAAIDAAKGELRELESKKKLLETEIGSAEELRAKYRTQQLAVKKNDEYQALGNEIDHAQAQIDELEGRELETLYAIDEARKRFAAAEATLKQNIVGHEARIRSLQEKGVSLAEEHKAAVAAVAQARGGGLRCRGRPADARRRSDTRRKVRGLPPQGFERGRVRCAWKDEQQRVHALRPVRAAGLLGVLIGLAGGRGSGHGGPP